MVRTVFVTALLARPACASPSEPSRGEAFLADSPFAPFSVETDHGRSRSIRGAPFASWPKVICSTDRSLIDDTYEGGRDAFYAP
jgi:hypothetical protein